MNAMKKIVLLMIVAAAALVGCQKSEELTVSTGEKIQLTASASLPTEGRAIISKDENGVYRSRWAENEYLYLVEDCEGGSGSFLSQSMVRENEGETASFSFAVDEIEASSYTYIATTAPVAIATRALFIDLADEQYQYYEGGSYDAAFDVLLSKAVVMDAQPATEGLRFSMQRLNGALKLSVKNLALATGEEVESITFACEQPIVGEVKVTFDDLAAGTYPIPFEVEAGKTAVKTSIYNTTGNFEVFYSCLPATLKAGESYTVTVKTNQATYHKVATLPADMVIAPNEITSVSVNMGDAVAKGVASTIANFDPSYEYAIGYTENDKTYLLPTTATALNPALKQVGVDIAGVTIDANGVIKGAIPQDYRWNITQTNEGYYQFWYMNGSTYHLISCAKAQGLAVSNNNTGNYSATYVNTFAVTETEGGYVVKNSAENRYLQADATNNRWGQPTGAPAGVINFYRINPSVLQESLYPVITEAALVMDGTYVLLCKDASGNYYTMKNDKTLVAPAAIPIAEIGLTITDGVVTAADVPNLYKWIIAKNNDGNINIKSATNTSRFLREKNNSDGFAIVNIEEYATAKSDGEITGVYESSWLFVNDAVMGMQAIAGANERHMGINGTNWAGFKPTSCATGIVLVKLSDSTKQINE